LTLGNTSGETSVAGSEVNSQDSATTFNSPAPSLNPFVSDSPLVTRPSPLIPTFVFQVGKEPFINVVPIDTPWQLSTAEILSDPASWRIPSAPDSGSQHLWSESVVDALVLDRIFTNAEGKQAADTDDAPALDLNQADEAIQPQKWMDLF
jgi:hypothetical protein